MVTTQSEARPEPALRRASRRHEIITIALVAIGALLLLCLASYNPNDASWNAAGQPGKIHNLVGSVGANTAATLFQAFGLAAALVPVLLLVAAWRCFRVGKLHAPASRAAGLSIIVLTVAGLLALSGMEPLFDRSVEPGGLLGALIGGLLASGLNAVGASVLLFAILATGVLLATNFSFFQLYERAASWCKHQFAMLRTAPARFTAWLAERRKQAQERAEQRRQDRLTPAERVAEFMRETAPPIHQKAASANVVTKRATADSGAPSLRQALLTNSPAAPPTTVTQDFSSVRITPAPKIITVIKGDDDDDRQATAIDSPAAATSGGRLPPPLNQEAIGKRDSVTATPNAAALRDETAKVEEMIREAAVVRTELDESDVKAMAFEAKKPAPKRQQLDYRTPSLELLKATPPRNEQDDEELLALATQLAEKLREFNVTGQIKHICPGPVVTTFEFKPDAGVKYSRVTNLVDDLCLALKAESIRIDRLPGKPHVGIEVPNPHRETIYLREVIESRSFRESTSKLTLALGKTIDGLNYVADLSRMPHLLIAGATGAGKSVCLNSLVVSILYKASPDEVKFIMVDPKRLELGLYADIPHLATPIITDPKRASNALRWAVGQMEQRYKDLAGWGVRNIDGYNVEVARRNESKEYGETGEAWKPLPYLVIIIDELADLMMVSGHEVEESITRLAQMARAVGIHLVLATQRPSVDVITGLIKANFPSRISCRVSSKVDSRTILDTNGAEQLLGRGDMLFLPPGTSRLVRVHGAYLDEVEVAKIVESVKAQAAPNYDETITQSEDEAAGADGGSSTGSAGRDELFDDALRICVEMKRASTSVLQRRLRIGYGRAAAILDHMEREGYIGQADGARPRPVLGRAHEIVAHWDELAVDKPV